MTARSGARRDCDGGAAYAMDEPAAAFFMTGGRLAVADFAPHDLEFLREQCAHRRLGFVDDEVTAWCHAAGLKPGRPIHLAGNPLTVTLWSAVKNGDVSTEQHP